MPPHARPRRFVADMPSPEPYLTTKTYLLKDVIEVLGVSTSTMTNWMRRGFAPRREGQLGERSRVSIFEIQAWLETRDADRKASKKPHLRKPIKPGSWFARADQLRREAYYEALALAIYRSSSEQGVALSDDQLGQMVARVVTRARAKDEASAQPEARA
jgi:predicted DNA-binding transcriptional regulator AlpA